MPTSNYNKNKARPTERLMSFGRGFTIIESLIAITILIVVVTSVTGAVQTGMSAYIFSKNQIIAFYLAQEGFEQIRNKRDQNILSSQPSWLTGISANPGDPCLFGNACYVDPINSTGAGIGPFSCGGTCQLLRQNATTGFYGYNSGWPTTIFRRSIVLTSINPNEISITVTVDWSKGTTQKQFKARENLLNWQ